MSVGKVWVACWLFLTLIGGGLIWAAEDHKALQLIARIQPRASLGLDRAQIIFAGGEDQLVIPAQEGPLQVTVKVRASASRPATLNVRAESDLEKSSGNIPIQQVQWISSGDGVINGALSRTHEQKVGRWTSSGIHKAQLNFVLKSQGILPPGEYSTSVNFSLISP